VPDWLVGTGLFLLTTLPFILPVAFFLVREGPPLPRWKTVLWVGVPVLVFLLVHPLGQLLTLGPVDRAIRNGWCERARQEHLVGKTEQEVRALFGAPNHVSQRAGGTRWGYAPIPFLILSDDFRVFFKDGKVAELRCDPLWD
jgi:hypothetical protein